MKPWDRVITVGMWVLLVFIAAFLVCRRADAVEVEKLSPHQLQQIQLLCAQALLRNLDGVTQEICLELGRKGDCELTDADEGFVREFIKKAVNKCVKETAEKLRPPKSSHAPQNPIWYIND